jgi:hypothetical protein
MLLNILNDMKMGKKKGAGRNFLLYIKFTLIESIINYYYNSKLKVESSMV